MGDFNDMPPLVDPHRFEAAPPTIMQMGHPFGSFDAGFHAGAAPPQAFSPGPAFLGPPPWASQSGFESQGSTPMSWGSSSVMSTPMLGAAVPAMAVMPAAFPVSSEGWPRPLANANREPIDSSSNSPPWRDREDAYERERMLVPRSNTPLSRSLSLSSSPSTASLSSHSLSRKTSLRGNAAEALKRPPRDWRPDFSLSGTGLLSGLLGTRGRSKSFGGGGPKVVVHPYILYNASKPPMHLDLREDPNNVKFRALKDRPMTHWDLMRFVCEPPLPEMRLYHPHLPWYIDVEADNPAGVTLYELFKAIYFCMMTQIQNADYYNVEMSNEARQDVATAYAERCRTEQERSQGIRRVDYLRGRLIMEGIQKGKDGMWEIRTRKPGAL